MCFHVTCAVLYTSAYAQVYIVDLHSHHGTHLRRDEIISRPIVPDVPIAFQDGDILTISKPVGKDPFSISPTNFMLIYDTETVQRPPISQPVISLVDSPGTLFPHLSDPPPRYAQLYFYDAREGLDYRMRQNKELSQKTNVQATVSIVTRKVSYTRLKSCAYSVERVGHSYYSRHRYGPPSIQRTFRGRNSLHLFRGDETRAVDARDIVLHMYSRRGGVQFINDHQAYLPLHYLSITLQFFPF